MDFTQKTVLITGASRGIGRACAILFAEAGARVAINYQRNRTAAEETQRMLNGDGHLIVQADVADANAVSQMVNTTVEQFGRLDILVNNAGIYEMHPIADVSYEDWQAAWQRTLNANLVGAANACYCAAQHMMAHGGGKIINITSRGAFRGEPEAPAYGASKAAMNAMSQSLAKALAPHNIIVTAVAPGWVDTDMAAGHLTEAVKAQSPLHRAATADEIARTVLFLASEGVAYITGAIVDVNGASYLRT
ncbi:MAG: SDR family oxidoreductase [Chloroflexi bacterium]|nr:MAG: SDR family oxidoreductase [Chloroflexota bacterium]